MDVMTGVPTVAVDETPTQWNETHKEYPLNRCLHELIEDQVRRTPRSSALHFEDQRLSYAELNERANRCAHYLRGMGVGPDSIVGVLMERSVEMVVALLGIMKAGGAYLPLDPDYPEERLSFMLEDAGVSVLFTQQRFTDLVPDFRGTKFSLDSEWNYLSAESGADIGRAAEPQHLAYVIFTSGSTGKPKGCMLSHKAICNRLLWMQDAYVLSSEDRVLQKTPFTFDVSVWELFWPLMTGACLVVAKPGGHKDSNYLVETIRKQRVTVCHFVPSMLRFFIGNPDASCCESLRHVFTSGEALSFDLVMGFRRLFSARLHNLYGPTEAAVDVTYWECEEREDKRVPIGRPISNIKTYILDQDLKQVSIGHEGELHIGGIGLARGYLNRPELTAEKFIANPFRAEPGAKLYKTGDKARYLPDGNIEFLGRIDFQVKLRGNRIELGEIETVLRTHAAVREAVVLVKGEESGDPKLVAYLLAEGEAPTSKQIREYAKAKLPDYMVPNVVAILDSMPVTQHGKLDRRALPWPIVDGGGDSRIPKKQAEPTGRQQITAVLVDYLEKALGVTDLKNGDDLFDLGATSLTMVQLVENIQSRFGVLVPIDVFLEDPTITSIVRYLSAELGSAGKVGRGDDTVVSEGDVVPDESEKQEERRTNAKMSADPSGLTAELSRIFREVLGLEALSANDDLFDAGATSLTMVQMVEKIQKLYDVAIPVEVFLEVPTIAAIVEYLALNLEAQPAQHLQLPTAVPTVDETSVARGGAAVMPSMAARHRETGGYEEMIPLQHAGFKESAYSLGCVVRSLSGNMIPFSDFSHFLALLKMETVNGEPKYLYPSAGGLNADQTYLYVKENAINGISKGIYYYHPQEHSLYLIDDAPLIDSSIFPEYDHPLFDAAGFALFIIAQMDAITPVYQAVSPTLVTLDAGYMGQLLLSRQADFKVGLCPVAGVDFDRIRAHFKLEENHRFIHCLLGGSTDGGAKGREDSGVVGYLQRTGKALYHHFLNPSTDGTFSAFLAAGSFVKYEKMKYLTKEEHDLFHAKQVDLRKFSRGEPVIPLDRAKFPDSDYLIRSSIREYESKPIRFEQLSRFLSLLRQEDKDSRSNCLYPSLSGNYGVQAYLYIKENGVEGLAEGIYYYHPTKHALVLVTRQLSQKVKPSHTPFNRTHYQKSMFSLFLIGQSDARDPEQETLYFALLEAGYIGQLLMDRQAEFDMGICPIGGLNFEKIRDDFKLNDDQVLLHSFTCGAFEREMPKERRYLEVGRGEAQRRAEPLQQVAVRRRLPVQHDIAIIGMSGRYPGAETLDAYWANLNEGKVSIGELPEGRKKLWSHLSLPEGGRKSTFRGGYLEDIDCFDNLLFDMSPSQSRSTDPQERLLLEVAWECLENAGYTPEQLKRCSGSIGVFVGAMWNDYQNQDPSSEDSLPVSALHSTLANRISYFFDFSGPSVAFNTSCSSAMTAIHFACESIKRGECDAAVVGGVNLITHPYHQGLLTGFDLLSKDGECRPLGAQTNGWLPGEGIGVILIKPLEDAERDNDHIYGVIKGTSIGHSGRTARFGAPSSARQSEAIRKAIDGAELSVESISYVEMAAAGASLADASEAHALIDVFKYRAPGLSPCFVGSVKANIGHLESASAFSQISKVLLQMKHGKVAPTVNFKPLSPLIRIEGSGLEIPDRLTPWGGGPRGTVAGAPLDTSPRVALVNALGATGSSGHVLLQEYIGGERTMRNAAQPTLVQLSAATPEQLHQYAARLHNFLGKEENRHYHVSSIGYTLRVGRIEMEERLALVVSSTEELRETLRAFLQGDENGPSFYRGTAVPEAGTETIKDHADLFYLAERWVQGAHIEEDLEKQGKVPLPTYPFARERHWVKRASGHCDERNGEICNETFPSASFTSHQCRGLVPDALLTKAEEYLKALFSRVSEIPVSRIDANTSLEKYGISSLMITALNEHLERDFEELSKTLFFEYRTIRDVAEYILKCHAETSTRLFGIFEPCSQSTVRPLNTGLSKREKSARVPVCNPENGDIEVAIIGLSGTYPKSATIGDFWQNLKNGTDCITEIPLERWDYREYSGAGEDGSGKFSKWGGFIDDIDKFDPMFFNISPREAEVMDPQERLFLECVWHTFEDAGYNRQGLKLHFQGKVGIFVGVMYGEYQLLSDVTNKSGDELLALSSHGSIANRVSYVFDFHGPSMAVDTLCSSSLTALHLAVESIKRGECSAAIAGGVNLSLHPYKYLVHSQFSMPSSDGRCRSFGEGGDGFVPGEGIGAVLLKPLREAVKDGDHVYAVIKGTSVNHDGKTNGYTVPNPAAQAELIAEVLRKTDIDPSTISYVEAHGTGTALGDPIEIAGLTNSFGAFTDKKQFCSIGSVKSNIGHLESAAGIAGLTKVLLQMKYGQLVPSLHSTRLNPNVNFARTPFHVQQELKEWKKPLLDVGGKLIVYPRRAAISSFGAGGANGHVIVEEYELLQSEAKREVRGGHIIVLSAKNEERLKKYALQMLAFIRTGEVNGGNLAEAAYTLQVGREPMEQRIATQVDSVEELEEKLGQFVEGKDEITGLCRGRIKRGNENLDDLWKDGEIQKAVEAWIAKGEYAKILDLWVKGMSIDWNRLYGDRLPRRISLPTYPFARERYWVSETKAKSAGGYAIAAHGSIAAIHPLLHQNTSDFFGQRFSSTFSKGDPFLTGSAVNGEQVLKPAACLEMARSAVGEAASGGKEGKNGMLLKNVVWGRPLSVGERPVQVHIGLYPKDEEWITYEIYSELTNSEDSIIHCQGMAKLTSFAEVPTLDLEALQRLGSNITSKEGGTECWATSRWIDLVYAGKSQILAKLSIPSSVSGDGRKMILHPDLLETVLQALPGLMTGFGSSELFQPIALQELELIGNVGGEMWAIVKYHEERAALEQEPEVDISLCDEAGNISLRMKGVKLRHTNGYGENANESSNASETATGKHREGAVSGQIPLETSVNHLKGLLGEVTKIPVERLDEQAHFEELGLDSIMIANLNQKVEQWVGKLDSTLFFKYDNLRSLGVYLAEAYPEAVSGLIRENAVSARAGHHRSRMLFPEVPALFSIRPKTPNRNRNFSVPKADADIDIAIIGVAGRYPKANNLNEFWKNLYDGKDCVGEIPPDRWSLDGFFEPDRIKAIAQGLSYSKWGGFLNDIECFDPLFFNISPRDAMFMDPQERLFLETVWKCVEDSGYTRKALEEPGYGNKIGVFVGATFNSYQLIMAESAFKAKQEMYVANSQIFSIANRVSFVMNFTGPSLTLDTACSSSLYALHMACDSIRNGYSRMAIAGGVNLSLHPSKYITLAQGQFHASDGRCRAFSEGGTGYVPSDGVGAVFLKPLQQAIDDRDFIYGIVKGTAVNHAGKTNGYTVPNPASQSLVIEEAIRRSGIDPRTISCIEAHGTGTALGDPIEIAGLTDVFRKYTKDIGFCSISSVKSNMGHAEAAAGIAQLTKVLLQFKHQTLVKNLIHGKGLNPNIDFSESPFLVQQDTQHWKRPVVDGQEFPRRAGISSFGAGGANAHIVVEEYIQEAGDNVIPSAPQTPAIVVLSAKDEDRLKEQAQQLLTAIREQQFSDHSLADIAYTLQTGREAMEERLALIVESVNELGRMLEEFLEGRAGMANCFRGQVKSNKKTMSIFIGDEEVQKAVEAWIVKGEYAKVSELWAKGMVIDWSRLYGNRLLRRISLPTYPFARERYWVPGTKPESAGDHTTENSGPAAAITPHRHASDFSGQRVRSIGFGKDLVTIAPDEAIGTMMIEPCWEEKPLVRCTAIPNYLQRLVVLCEAGVLREDIEAIMKDIRCLVLESENAGVDARFRSYTTQLFEEIKDIFLRKPKGNVLVQVVVRAEEEKQLFSGLSGLLMTAGLENPKLIWQLIEVDAKENADGVIKILEENHNVYIDRHVRYQKGKRWVASWSEMEITTEQADVPWENNGCYLITGGAGGLGFIFANEIVRQAKGATVILTGRSELSNKRRIEMDEMNSTGSRVIYRRMDVTRKEEVVDFMKDIRSEYGNLNGIIHGAGVIRDNFIIKKPSDEVDEVLAPKVTGLVNLDEASKDMPLDFFIFFSSGAGATGNIGQADYAAANYFMDVYARYRNELAGLRQRSGRTLSINWPFWKEGGMRVDEETEKITIQKIGVMPMRTETGIEALNRALASGKAQVLVMEGNVRKMKQALRTLTSSSAEKGASINNAYSGDSTKNLLACLQEILLRTAASLINVKADELDLDAELIEYGFDYVLLEQFAREVNREFNLDLPLSALVGIPSLNAVADYLIEEHKGNLQLWLQANTACAVFDEYSATTTSREIILIDTVQRLKEMVADVTKLEANRIGADVEFENYGIDSVMIIQLNQKLAEGFDGLSTTLLFEYQTIGALAEHLVDAYPRESANWVGIVAPVPAKAETTQAGMGPGKEDAVLASKAQTVNQPKNYEFIRRDKGTQEPIAIIGLSGRYPKAGNVEEYWENLKTARECITEISEVRWTLDGFYEPDPEKAVEQHKSYSKWGGFLEGFANFDSLFFKISPREASGMDPQERLFIENCWELLEDSGYTRERIATMHKGRVGVFAGITKTGFSLYGPELLRQGQKAQPVTSFSSVANRVSYLLNLKGPSMPIDTMCSSSLTAIHEACEHLHRGACEMAIAGGVNLYLHPSAYTLLASLDMLSRDSHSAAFGLGGDGFVPGEGVGCVLLKPLSMAEKDGDYIYAVIRGTHTNHSGKTNGYMVPNPNALTELMSENFRKSCIDPRTVSYVEAAAMGSHLGDPIEVNALVKAFSQYTKEKQYCAVGSVKPNIGHLEAASGISQLTKVILQLRHRQLVPTINPQCLNPDVKWEGTPFFLQKELCYWEKPVIEIDGIQQEVPRRAVVNSFGAGGANTHLIVEEYVPPCQPTFDPRLLALPQVVVFSAEKPDRLRAIVQNMIDFLQVEAGISLPNLAYTLQVGREAMGCRLAMVVGNKKELLDTLKAFAEKGFDGTNAREGKIALYVSYPEVNLAKPSDLDEANAAASLSELLAVKNLDRLAQLWVKGVKIPWERLHNAATVRRISLPTYPFAQQQYWISPTRVTGFNPQPADQGETGIEKKRQNNTPIRGDDSNVELTRQVQQMIGNLLQMNLEEVPDNFSLDEYGMDSIVLMEFYRKLRKHIESLEIGEIRQCKTLADIVSVIERKPGYDKIGEKMGYTNLSSEEMSRSLTRNDIAHIIINTPEIERQRQEMLKQLTGICREELLKREMLPSDADVPSFQTIDVFLDARNCIWVFFKTSLMGMETIADICALQGFIGTRLDLGKVPILYFTHYGQQFLLGGDRLLFINGDREIENDQFRGWFESLKTMIRSHPSERFPLLVAVCCGTAQGGGFEFLLACDFHFVLPQVKMGTPEIKSNLYAGMGGFSFLASQVGLPRAKFLNMTGDLIRGNQAYDMGIISHLTIEPFKDAYRFLECIPNIGIAKHINYRLNQQYDELRNRDLEDWFEVTRANVNEKYQHILEDYEMFKPL
ncbi:MAG TPA: amino acid adenylation domain-containing protein [Geobacteraceae bacterium]